MKNVEAFFAWIASVPELWEQFLRVMQGISPSDTEKMYKDLAAFATEHGFEEAASEMLKFYQEEADNKVSFTPGVREIISQEIFHTNL